MKTFKDLIFKNKYSDESIKRNEELGFTEYSTAKQARLDFPDNYGVSVITGFGAHGDVASPYELAVFYNGYLTYDTHITDDVIGYCTEEDITKYMIQIQELKDE